MPLYSLNGRDFFSPCHCVFILLSLVVALHKVVHIRAMEIFLMPTTVVSICNTSNTNLTRWLCWCPTAMLATVWACRCVLTYWKNNNKKVFLGEAGVHTVLETMLHRNKRQKKTESLHEWIKSELVARVGCVTNTGHKNIATLYNIDRINNMLSVTLIQSNTNLYLQQP